MKKFNLLIVGLVVLLSCTILFSLVSADQGTPKEDLKCTDVSGCAGAASCDGPGSVWYEIGPCVLRCQSGGGVVCLEV